MRTKNKDILMICKFCFIRDDKCFSVVSALREYLKSRTMCPEITDESILHHLTAAVGEFVDKDKLLMTLKKFATNDCGAMNCLISFLINAYISLLIDVNVGNIDLSDYVKIREYVNGCEFFEDNPQWWDKIIL